MHSDELLPSVRQMLEALESGDKERFLGQNTDNVIWNVEGQLVPVSATEIQSVDLIPFSGTWVRTEAPAFPRTVSDFFDVTQETLDISDIEILDLMQNDDVAVARANLEATVSETGLPIDIDLHLIIDLEYTDAGQEQIKEIEVLYNTFAVAQAFAGEAPAPEAVAFYAADPLQGDQLSVDPDADSAETLRVLRQAYDGIAQFDESGLQQFVNSFADDALTVYNGDPTVLPIARSVVGSDGLAGFIATTSEIFIPTRQNNREFLVNGDRGAVIVDVGSVSPRTGAFLDYSSVHYVTVEDGEISNLIFSSDTYALSSDYAGELLFVDSEEPTLPAPEPTPPVEEPTPPVEEPTPPVEEPVAGDGLSLEEIFDESYYLEVNPEAAIAVDQGEFANGLAHFESVGLEAGLRFTPLVDLDYYKQVANPDLAELSNSEALDHLLEVGIEEGRLISPFIDLEFYQDANPELAELTNSEALIHLRDTGLNENLQFSSFVNLEEYRSFSPALADLSLSEAFTHLTTFYAPEEEGRIEVPMNLGLNIPDEYSVLTPEVVTGSAQGTITYSKSANEVVIDLDLEGLPYRETFTRPEDISTPYNQQPISVEDAQWQLWLSGEWFSFESNYWYDGATGQLIGNEYDLEGGPVPTDEPLDINNDGISDVALPLPTIQSIGSPIFEGNPDGTGQIRLEYTYDQLLDELGTAGVYSTVLPYNLNRPDEVGVYYTEGGLPVSLAMTWDDVLDNIQNNERVQLAISVEPNPKPSYLDARPNLMNAWSGFYPLITPDGLVYDPAIDSYVPTEPSDLVVHANEPFPARQAEIERETESIFGGLEAAESFDAADPSDAFDGNRDTLFTGAGDDFVDASQAIGPVFPGTAGLNRVYGGTGVDELLAGRRDSLFGGEGDDILDASVGSGRNRLSGDAGNDELFAGTYDRLFGGEGDDILDASVGSGGNRLYGQAGNDTFLAGSGDRLLGGDGDDSFFVGDGGDNLITGGAGADAFWIATGEFITTSNTITDFELGVDVIGVSGLGAASAEDLGFSQSGADAIISFSNFDLAVLRNTEVVDLQANGNFAFA